MIVFGNNEINDANISNRKHFYINSKIIYVKVHILYDAVTQLRNMDWRKGQKTELKRREGKGIGDFKGKSDGRERRNGEWREG